MFQTYQPSGGFKSQSMIYYMIGLVAVGLLAVLYQFLLWIPIIFLSVLITAGFGFAVGWVTNKVITFGHIRNVLIGTLIAVSYCLFGLGVKFWSQYEVEFYQLSSRTVGKLDALDISDEDVEKLRTELRNTITFTSHIKSRVEQGWNIGKGGRAGIPITGLFVYVIWIIEAGIVIFIAAISAIAQANEPYSEKLEKWADQKDLLLNLPITDQEMIETVKDAQSIEQLLEIPIPKSDETNQFLSYTVNRVPGHEEEDSYLTVSLETYTVNNKGETTKESEELVEYAIMSNEQRMMLAEKTDLFNEALENYRQAQLEGSSDLEDETPQEPNV